MGEKNFQEKKILGEKYLEETISDKLPKNATKTSVQHFFIEIILVTFFRWAKKITKLQVEKSGDRWQIAGGMWPSSTYNISTYYFLLDQLFPELKFHKGLFNDDVMLFRGVCKFTLVELPCRE